MKILDYTDAIKNNDMYKLTNCFKDLDGDETYQIYLPDEVDFYFNNFSFSNGVRHDNVIYNEYEGAFYLGSKLHPYRALIKIKDETKVLNVHPDCIIVTKEAVKNHQNIEKATFNSDTMRIGESSFMDATNLKTIIFNCKDVVVGYKAFQNCHKLGDIQFGDAKYYFCNYSFDTNQKYFIFPRRITTMNECLNPNTKMIYIPKEITNLTSLLKVNVYGNRYQLDQFDIYYEGDCSNLLIKETVNQYVETPDDYAFNFHRSSGSFNYSHIYEPAEYATYDRCHSFVSLEDFLKIVKEK